MALSPIQIFQQQQSPLTAILQSGTTEISRVMDRAVQIGRDIANKQLAQEQDLLAMRRNETNLAQRRAENLQQDWEDTFRFVRGAYEFDTKMAADEAWRQQQFGANRQDEMFNRTMQQAQLGLSEQAGQREERRIDIAESEAQRRQAEMEAERQKQAANEKYYRDMFATKDQTGDAAPAQPFRSTSPYAPRGGRATAAPSAVASTTSMSVEDLYSREAQLESQLRGAPNQQARDAVAAELGRVKGQIAQLPSGTTGRTTDPLIQQKRELEVEEARRKATVEQARSLVTDTAAFPLWSVDMKESEPGFAEKKARVDARNQNIAASELEAARSYATEDAYVKAWGGKTLLTPEQEAKRRKLWQLANPDKSGGSKPGAVSQFMPP